MSFDILQVGTLVPKNSDGLLRLGPLNTSSLSIGGNPLHGIQSITVTDGFAITDGTNTSNNVNMTFVKQNNTVTAIVDAPVSFTFAINTSIVSTLIGTSIIPVGWEPLGGQYITSAIFGALATGPIVGVIIVSPVGGSTYEMQFKRPTGTGSWTAGNMFQIDQGTSFSWLTQ